MKEGNADTANNNRFGSDPSSNEPAELERLGITVTTATYFHWNGYRYTTARDALHAARRAETAVGTASNG